MLFIVLTALISIIVTVMQSDHDSNGKGIASSESATVQAAMPVRSHPRASIAHTFSQDKPLKFQLPFLLEAAKNNDSYAACVLARALQICRQRDDEGESDAFLDAYASEYTATLNNEEVASLANAVAIREKKASAICDQIIASDQDIFDDIVYKSAQSGDPVSMRIFALQHDKRTMFGDPVAVSKLHIDRHNKYAEQMLNRAADAGDPIAIRSIYSVYATGVISTSFDKVKVRRDAVKSIAAYAALKSVDDYRLKARSRAGDIAQAEAYINESVSGFNQTDHIRLARLKEAYVRAYRTKKDLERSERRCSIPCRNKLAAIISYAEGFSSDHSSAQRQSGLRP